MNVFRSSGGLAIALLPALAGARGFQPATPTDLVPPSFVMTPVLTPNANEKCPLSAKIAFQTDEATQIELALKDGERPWTVLAQPDFLTDHEVAVLEVRADRGHIIGVTARDQAGNQTTADVERIFDTPALSDFFPPFSLEPSIPGLSAPGLTLADFLVISTELRVYPDHPVDEVDPTPANPAANVVGDTRSSWWSTRTP